MIDYFLHSNLFLLMFDLDFDRIQLAESGRIFLKIGSDFIQDPEPILTVRTLTFSAITNINLTATFIHFLFLLFHSNLSL